MTTTNNSTARSHRRALICGVGGQDGSYLVKFLLSKGYAVIGSSRDAASVNRVGLNHLGIEDRVEIVSMAPATPATRRSLTLAGPWLVMHRS
jgi:GDPmannose 4,6-dehydratase